MLLLHDYRILLIDKYYYFIIITEYYWYIKCCNGTVHTIWFYIILWRDNKIYFSFFDFLSCQEEGNVLEKFRSDFGEIWNIFIVSKRNSFGKKLGVILQKYFEGNIYSFPLFLLKM